MAIAAAMGYGASTLSTSNDAAAAPILDERRLPQVNYASLKDMEKAIEEIQSLFSDVDGIISTDSDDLLAHGYSEWSSVNVDTLPVAVAYPRSTEHVSGIARICHKWKVPIIPFSGGSSVEGHISAPFGGVSIDFAYMDSVVKLNKEDMDVVVQPSVCWTDLNHELAKQGTGLWFPIDPGKFNSRPRSISLLKTDLFVAPSAKIGGMIGTNCSGTNAVRYGTMRDWVINMTVVLADGSVVKTRRRPRKCSAGYNLNGLIVGSEGTLGIVTEATLKLAAVPDHFSVAVVPFDDLRGAVSAAADIIRRGVQVAAVELMDETQMRIVNEGGATRPRVWKETPTLFLKFSGTKGTVDDNINTVREIMKPYSPLAFEFARDEHEQKMLWSARKESLYSLWRCGRMAKRCVRPAIHLTETRSNTSIGNTDVAVPLSRLADIIEDSKAHAASLGLKACVKGHIGDSNFHENITYKKTDPQEAERAKMAVKTMVKRALEMEGTCTGEHGVGIGKKDALLQEVGQDTIQVMKLLKGVLDPYWIMNPGKVFNR
ncbi:D-lactate ferricytochrome c oxidoreductase [Fusarium falciforme]|nr:D-lactate ferricytochrome c oxidoreductase [Fusarium falciforme]